MNLNLRQNEHILHRTLTSHEQYFYCPILRPLLLTRQIMTRHQEINLEQIWGLALNRNAHQTIRLMANYHHAQIRKIGQPDFDIQAVQLQDQIAF